MITSKIFFLFNCIIHHEHITARYLKYEEVTKPSKIAKTDPHFRNFSEDLNLEDKPSDVSFYCIVRYLSTSNGLNRFVEI